MAAASIIAKMFLTACADPKLWKKVDSGQFVLALLGWHSEITGDTFFMSFNCDKSYMVSGHIEFNMIGGTFSK